MTKRKDERRELLKEDEFLSFLERTAQYIAENKQRVLIASVLVLVALIAIFGLRGYFETQRYEQAGMLFQYEEIISIPLGDDSAKFQFENEKQRYEKAMSVLEDVLPKLKGSARIQGLIYKVDCMTMLGQTDGIEAVLQEIADSGSALAFIGVLGLGDYYADKGQYDEALEQYNRFLSMPRVPNMDVLGKYKIAKVHRAQGDLDMAKAVLNQLKSKYDEAEAGEKPPMMTEVDKLLEELKAESGDLDPAPAQG